MNNFIDTHIHLDLLSNLSNAIRYIEDNNIYVIAVTNHPKVYEALMNRIKSKFIRVSLGMHPELVNSSNITLFKKYVYTTKYIGEVGLDFSTKDEGIRTAQIELFNDILYCAKQKVLSIHSRKAENEVLGLIEKNYDDRSAYILHWFSGNKSNLKRAIAIGCYFSINYSMLTSKKFLENISVIPIDRILVETDSPFSKGDLFNLQVTYDELSKLLGCSSQFALSQIYNNFKELLYAVK